MNPELQDVHDAAAGLVENVPREHGSQYPVVVANVPFAHGVQDADSG